MLERANNNAYKLELPCELKISPTLNVADLPPFYAHEPILRSEPSQEGTNDEDIETSLTRAEEEVIIVPAMRQTPRKRSGTRSLREEFNKLVKSLITLIEHEELKKKLLTKEITREIPIRPQGDLISLKTHHLDNEQMFHYTELGKHTRAEIIKEMQENTYLKLKTLQHHSCRFYKETRFIILKLF